MPHDPSDEQHLPPEHDAALIHAYELVEQVQTGPDRPHPTLLDRWAAEARDRAWYHVELMIHLARLVQAQMDGQGRREVIADLERAAAASGDDALTAAVLALRSVEPVIDPDAPDDRDRDLARAAALLFEGGGTPLTRSLGFVACGNGYQRLGLWELQSQMYRHVDEQLARPIPDSLRSLGARYHVAQAYNRFQARSTLACELFEIGRREQARDLLAPDRVPIEVALGLPAPLVVETLAMESLTTAVLAEPPPLPAPELLAMTSGSTPSSTTGCILLAEAIRALDGAAVRGTHPSRDPDLDRAVDLARQALDLIGDGRIPGLFSLAMSIVTLGEPSGAIGRAYIADLLEQRRQARSRELQSALARLRSEQLILENERLSAQAYVDGLTGLGNRFTLDRQRERLRAGRDGTSVAVLLLDLNRFKPVNDTFGHAVGDEVLRRVADILRRTSRPTDLTVRMGGDEFVLLLLGCDAALAMQRAASITDLVAEADWSDLTPGMVVGVSIGTAAGPPGEIDDLLEQADRDMYERKHQTRQRER